MDSTSPSARERLRQLPPLPLEEARCIRSHSSKFSLFAVYVLAATACFHASCRSQDAAPAGMGAAEPAWQDMIEIPGGAFIYGTSEPNFERLLSLSRVSFPGIRERLRSMQVIPERAVTLDRFYIDEFEVSNEQFHRFLEESGYRPDAAAEFLKHWQGRTVPPDWAASFPVVWVSGQDAEAYCRWRGLRLPTDEEWERAARGTDGRIFPWGNDYATGDGSNQGSGRLEPTGNRAADRSAEGVYDLGGNVSELVSLTSADGHGGFAVRGGSFSSSLWDTLTYYRLTGIGTSDRFENVGFRCAGRP